MNNSNLSRKFLQATYMAQQVYDSTYFEGIDSTYSLYDYAQDVVLQSKLFHETNPYLEGVPRITWVENWMIAFLLICCIGIAYVRSVHRKRYQLLVKTLFNWKIAKQIIRYEKVYTHPANLILISIFALSTPLLFGLLSSQHFEKQDQALSFALLIAIPLIAYVLIKLLLHHFFAWLFNIKEAMKEYLFQSSLFNKIYGILNLSFIVLFLFSGVDILLIGKISLFTLAALLLLQLSRAILIGRQYNIFPLLIILYLCTLEILPWLFIGKLISNQLN